MEKPVKIAYHRLSPSDAVSEMVRQKVARLERYFDRITGCSVTLEVPGHRHRHGKHFRVRIELTVPGERLVVGRDPAQTKTHEDLVAAVNAAFQEARRQLEDHARRVDHRGRARPRAEPSRGKVLRLFREDGYGFLETADGREVYFHERSVLRGGFKRMRVGTPVRFAEEPGEKGPQASTVVLRRVARRTA